MTEQEFDALPDREKDAAVAEARGWEAFTCGYFDFSESPRQREIEEWLDKVGLASVGDYFIDVESDFWKAAEDWKPTTSTATAWELVEEMTEDDPWFHLAHFSEDGWKVEFTTKGGGDSTTIPGSPTAPLAICIAYMKAKGAIVG
ncbi:MAG: hypothetical protein KAJ55_00265 [Anaerolineales bacterium]|nr:hypothetical protein [Anaerolineales bacterium]